MTGYLIEYKEKTSFLYYKEPGDNFTEKRRALAVSYTHLDVYKRQAGDKRGT